MVKPDYLRISLTDRCNLNCIYCTPLKRKDFLSHGEVLRYEEIAKLTEIFVRSGIKKIRLTGGEPLIKKNIADLVKMLKEIKGLREVSLTTNGVMLAEYIKDLKKAGLDRLNISLDTLQRDKFKEITGLDCLDKVWQGIKLSLKLNLSPVKINVVPIAKINSDELTNFARLTLKLPVTVRFIEFFHTNERSKKLFSSFIPTESIKKMITAKLGVLHPAGSVNGRGPAVYYRLKNAKGAVGFISPTTENFCTACRRLRLDCTGKLYPCLFSGFYYDIKKDLRDAETDEEIAKKIAQLIAVKPNYTKNSAKARSVEMSKLGG